LVGLLDLDNLLTKWRSASFESAIADLDELFLDRANLPSDLIIVHLICSAVCSRYDVLEQLLIPGSPVAKEHRQLA